MQFHLPWPPTSNSMFGLRGSKRFLSDRYKRFRDEAGLELIRQKARPVKGPVSITIELRSPNKATWDIDNRVKAILDVLVEMMILPDDDSHTVRELLVQAHHGEQIPVGARVKLTGIGSESS